MTFANSFVNSSLVALLQNHQHQSLNTAAVPTFHGFQTSNNDDDDLIGNEYGELQQSPPWNNTLFPSNASRIYPEIPGNLAGSASWEEAFRDTSRFWVQRVLVPLVVIIGVMGNAVTIYILTRRPMRSSTNV